MGVVKPITITLGVSDTLLVMDGLKYITEDKERHELDKYLAQDLIDRVKAKVKENKVYIEREG